MNGKNEKQENGLSELLGTIDRFEKCFVRIAKAYGLTPLVLIAMAENNEENYADILTRYIETHANKN
ncbi:hypothetical protein LCGC14_1463960 [marine sediment metagenome]|uniref:Uncharacterized protein n=1 Tax=marine sediment metagenome TaxID=412755 RepID=A0A0F9K091_9ZZZZ